MRKKRDMTDKRLRRKRRIRNVISGSADKPRLSVFRSNKNIYVQLIDDITGETLVSASTLDADVASIVAAEPVVTLELDGAPVEFTGKRRAAVAVGQLVAQRAAEKEIARAVFDRNGYIYHGRVAAVAAGARAGGLDF